MNRLFFLTLFNLLILYLLFVDIQMPFEIDQNTLESNVDDHYLERMVSKVISGKINELGVQTMRSIKNVKHRLFYNNWLFNSKQVFDDKLYNISHRDLCCSMGQYLTLNTYSLDDQQAVLDIGHSDLLHQFELRKTVVMLFKNEKALLSSLKYNDILSWLRCLSPEDKLIVQVVGKKSKLLAANISLSSRVNMFVEYIDSILEQTRNYKKCSEYDTLLDILSEINEPCKVFYFSDSNQYLDRFDNRLIDIHTYFGDLKFEIFPMYLKDDIFIVNKCLMDLLNESSYSPQLNQFKLLDLIHMCSSISKINILYLDDALNEYLTHDVYLPITRYQNRLVTIRKPIKNALVSIYISTSKSADLICQQFFIANEDIIHTNEDFMVAHKFIESFKHSSELNLIQQYNQFYEKIC